MIEIALCLAIIGVALVAIIGVLPLGMNTQRDVREQTIINQDATVLLEAIRSGARGADYLTNYVYAIVNSGDVPAGYLNPTLAGQMNFPNANSPSVTWNPTLINGANIIGLLSLPEYLNGTNNHIIAYVRSISGLAAEQPPQNNGIMVGGTFSYQVYCVNAATANPSPGFANNLHELRLTFLWPQLPNGKYGKGRQTFRAAIAGQLAADPVYTNLYFYQPQSFH